MYMCMCVCACTCMCTCTCNGECTKVLRCTSTLFFRLEEQHFERHRARVKERVLGKRRCAHRRWDTRAHLERHNHWRGLIAARVDGDAIALQDVDQVILVVVQLVLLTDRHCQHARDPTLVLCQDLVTARSVGGSE
uniref:Secreted protein n=1 Tax=Haptolina brevifila TaxID=156173 RepID=A0A7S2CJ61_9EUKA